MPGAAIFKTSLDVLYYSGASAALRRFFGGNGAIFMLHHVFPGGGKVQGFAPNAGLEVTPEFLDQVISMLKSSGFDLVNLGEAADRIENGGRPFAAFTLDDGYRDNLVHAQPVFARHGCPYTIFVAPAIADGTCELWWRGLELAIARNGKVTAGINGETLHIPTSTVEEKWQAWKVLYWPVRRMEQHAQRTWITEFCGRHGIDLQAMCREAAMNWDELRQISADPLCTIGAHTIHHFNVKALSAEESLGEMTGSADRIESELGKRPEFFSYPYGDETSAGPREFELARAAGFKAAVTTRKGMIFDAHRDHPTALPRFSLAGEYQNLRYVRALLSGVPFALFNGMRTVNVG
jgi:peptidoglycan/xylan/chitin deacetylase (PgdA/CDA1 family)